MITKRIIAMATAVTLTGFAQLLVAQDTSEPDPADTASSQDVSGQDDVVDAGTTEETGTLQPVTQPAENLLSDIRIYPSF